MKVLLINLSKNTDGTPAYNLGMAKARSHWQKVGAEVLEADSFPRLFAGELDVVWISAIFSWDVPLMIQCALQALDAGKAVEVGGPGTFGVRDKILKTTGLEAQATPDSRFERERGIYEAVFWKFTLYTDVIPAPVILDNNLSALPFSHQQLIVESTLACDFEEVDANRGFEPRSFRPRTAELWKQLPLKAWRFAFDEMGERDAVLRMMKILDDAGVSRKKRRIYCLIGNEPIAACEARVREIQSWGSLPIVQRRRPLDWMAGPLPALHDWTEQTLIDCQRWGNRLSGAMPFAEYRRGTKDGDERTLDLEFE